MRTRPPASHKTGAVSLLLVSLVLLTRRHVTGLEEARQDEFDGFTMTNPIIRFGEDQPAVSVVRLPNTDDLPVVIWMEMQLNGDLISARLRRNPFIVHPRFNVEAIDSLTTKGQLIANASVTNHCYYTGHVVGNNHSLVAVSFCDGMKGLFRIDEKEFFIEPTEKTSDAFPHLIYENKHARPRISHKPTGPTCITKPDDEVDPLSIFNVESRRTRRKRNSASPQGRGRVALDVLLVVDKYMARFHGNMSLEAYVLTMMNMAAESFHDSSLGVTVDLTVAKIIVLNEDQKELKISHHGDKTLMSFCQWQYSNTWYSGHDNKYVLKYDVALLLTRKDVCFDRNVPCGTIGMAYIGGVCRPKRKCGVIEDIGLNTAFTIAHEIGHLLGMTHDGYDNQCDVESGGIPHMMSSQWPQASYMGALKWSRCSRNKLKELLSSPKSFCLQPSVDLRELLDRISVDKLLPGSIYDADQQCALQFGSLAQHCTHFKISTKKTDMCRQLWCEIEGEDECVTKLDPAAQGTQCAIGKWCMYGNCIDNSTIPRQVDGLWGDWGNWSQCSRTCGIGVKIMERKCDSPKPKNGGRYCAGRGKRYQTCNTQACPPQSRDFRLEQCEQFNNDTFKWIPVHSDRNPCALFCRPAIHGIHVSVQFESVVVHGTKCWKGSTDICVDGKCEKVGCDNELQSKMERDICGVCGGNDTSCNLVEGKFTQKQGEGYVTAVVIPRDAENIIVKEEQPCASFLALKSGYGTFHINGNWKIELPGEYNVDGTIVYYQRSGTQETFYAKGPTKVPLHIMVLFQEFNFGVKFRYVVPLNNTENESQAKLVAVKDGSFGWMRKAWGICSVVCGGGIMERGLHCIRVMSNNVTVVDETFCSGAKAPPRQEKICNEHKCPVTYAVTAWGPCSSTCGLGKQKRTSRCVGQKPDGSWIVRRPDECRKNKPMLVRTCVRRSCFLQWKVGEWSKCSGLCERRGVRYRTVECPVENACSSSVQPTAIEACISPNCSYQWVVKDWSECNATCGEGFRNREVVCTEEHSFVHVLGKCNNETKPSEVDQCPPLVTCKPTTQPVTEMMSVNYTEYINQTSATTTTTPTTTPMPITNSTTPQLTTMATTQSQIKPTNQIAKTAGHCMKDKLRPWACRILADVEYCQEEKNRIRCCLTCQKFIKPLSNDI